jgi:hypothetical protein
MREEVSYTIWEREAYSMMDQSGLKLGCTEIVIKVF